jgi:3-oxoacyl-[acyl-carrier protein] reductase
MLTEQQRKFILDSIPLGRYGTTEEVATAINFLCLPEAGYITGQILCVDGGMAMHV